MSPVTETRYSTVTGAEIDPWKKIAALTQERDMLKNALHDALDKIELYHKATNGEYKGGVPNQVLLPQIRRLLGLQR